MTKSLAYVGVLVLVVGLLLGVVLSAQACVTCRSDCGQLRPGYPRDTSFQYEDFKFTYRDYKYWGCEGEGSAVCTGETETKLNHINIYDYKDPPGHHEDPHDNQVCKCD